MVFSRQGLAHQVRSDEQIANIDKGAYTLVDCSGTPDVILIATGSEVELARQAAEQLTAKGKAVRVVSMPCAEIFDKQSKEYRESVLPSAVAARVAIEAAHKDYWYKWVGLNGEIIGKTTFGESAPIDDLMKEFGFTVENVVAAAERVSA